VNLHPKSLFLFALGLILISALFKARADTPITGVVPHIDQLQKWDFSFGDTWDPFWADDGNLYSFSCDGRGFGNQTRNFLFNKLTGDSLASLKGELVNTMDEYGASSQKEADNATWKVCGQECIDGVFYAFVARNVYGGDGKDPTFRQSSFNASLIKSTDKGLTWTRTAKENYATPMWPGGRFGAPGFFHFGKDGGHVSQDGADQYVYAISNNGFWDGGDNFILGRVRRSDLPKLNAADWTYLSGDDGTDAANWSSDVNKARLIVNLPGKCGWTSPTFIPALHCYVLISWYVTPAFTDKSSWFNPNEVKYDFLQAQHPWGPWTPIGSLSDKFMVGSHMYGPNICPDFQHQENGGVEVSLFTSGCPFEDLPTGLYKLWEIPLLLKTTPTEPSYIVNDDNPRIVYQGDWQPSAKRNYHDIQDDVHSTNKLGASAELKFTGTGVDLISEKNSDMGAMDIYLDGHLEKTARLWITDFPRLAGVTVFHAENLGSGEHTIKAINKSGAFGMIDAFRIYGSSPPSP
jgi:hypothetical protein